MKSRLLSLKKCSLSTSCIDRTYVLLWFRNQCSGFSRLSELKVHLESQHPLSKPWSKDILNPIQVGVHLSSSKQSQILRLLQNVNLNKCLFFCTSLFIFYIDYWYIQLLTHRWDERRNYMDHCIQVSGLISVKCKICDWIGYSLDSARTHTKHEVRMP